MQLAVRILGVKRSMVVSNCGTGCTILRILPGHLSVSARDQLNTSSVTSQLFTIAIHRMPEGQCRAGRREAATGYGFLYTHKSVLSRLLVPDKTSNPCGMDVVVQPGVK